MAVPRIFASSTCYDLADERDGLTNLCDTFGFDIALSERGDIFYHPDVHTHVSCVKEITNCHIFVLIIGGRFGGKYIVDKSKSITNAEYSAARELGIPIFTFIKQDVLNDHNVWQKNKAKPFANEIIYPSIEKQEFASDIFTFIDHVRLAPTNNGVFGFSLIKEIQGQLKKQWAAMFFEYLQNRSLSRQLASTNETLASLSVASTKIEEMVKNIYKTVDTASADAAITSINLESKAREFFRKIGNKIGDREFIPQYTLPDLIEKPPAEWIDFLLKTDYFSLQDSESNENITMLIYDIMSTDVIKVKGELNKSEKNEQRVLTESYAAYLSLSVETRKKIISDYIWVRSESIENRSKA